MSRTVDRFTVAPRCTPKFRIIHEGSITVSGGALNSYTPANCSGTLGAALGFFVCATTGGTPLPCRIWKCSGKGSFSRVISLNAAWGRMILSPHSRSSRVGMAATLKFAEKEPLPEPKPG